MNLPPSLLSPFWIQVLPVLLGWLSLWAHFHSWKVQAQGFVLTLNWAYLFPVFASLAWGMRGAWQTTLLGGAWLYPFLLWPDNGWGNLVTGLYTALWFLGLGWVSSRGLRVLVLFQLSWASLYIPWVTLVMPWALQCNPAFWVDQSISSMPSTVLWSIAAKGFFAMSSVVLLSAVLLRIPSLRGYLGLRTQAEYKDNLKILLGGLGISAVCLFLYKTFMGIFVLHNFPLGVWDWSHVEDIAVIIAVSCGALMAVLFVCTQVERRNLIFLDLQGTQSELQQAKDHLEEKVAARTQELAKALLKVESATRAKSTFLANMSHELRTPLHAILGLGHQMSQGGLETLQQERLQRMERAAQGLLAVVNDVLDYAKIEAGKAQLQPATFGLADHLEHWMEMIRFTALDKQLELTWALSPNAPEWVQGDAFRLGQVLLNLCGNAVKFTAQGSVQLHVEYAAGRAHFWVRDTGIGLAPEQCARIFEPFEQADVSTSRSYGGTGLGLTISQYWIQQMGGSLSVQSVLGQGSVFEFEIELPTSSPPSAQPGVEVLSSPKGLGKILLVDDQEMNLWVGAELLEQVGFEVVCATGGVQAMERLRAEPEAWTMVLLDLQMPVVDGMQTLALIRAEDRWKSLPVYALSADTQVPDGESGPGSFQGYLSKPLDPQIVLGLLSSH